MDRVWRTLPPLRAISCSGACQPELPPVVVGRRQSVRLVQLPMQVAVLEVLESELCVCECVCV